MRKIALHPESTIPTKRREPHVAPLVLVSRGVRMTPEELAARVSGSLIGYNRGGDLVGRIAHEGGGVVIYLPSGYHGCSWRRVASSSLLSAILTLALTGAEEFE